MTDHSSASAPLVGPGASPQSEAAVLAEARRRSRRSFIGLGLAGLAGLGGWRWLLSQPTDEGIPRPLRKVLDANSRLTSAYFKETRLAPEFARSRAIMPRENGDVGLDGEVDGTQAVSLSAGAPFYVGVSAAVQVAAGTKELPIAGQSRRN